MDNVPLYEYVLYLDPSVYFTLDRQLLWGFYKCSCYDSLVHFFQDDCWIVWH